MVEKHSRRYPPRRSSLSSVCLALLLVGGVIAGLWYVIRPDFSGSPQEPTPVETRADQFKADGKLAGNGAEPVSSLSQHPSGTQPTSSAPSAATTPPSELDLLLEQRYPMPEILPLEQIVGAQWEKVPLRAYPAEITAVDPVPFELKVDGQVVGSTQVPPGTPMKAVNLVGGQLTVQSLADASMRAVLPLGRTDFRERVTERYQAYVKLTEEQVAARRENAKKILQADPERLASLLPSSGGALKESVQVSVDSDDPRFDPVRRSIQAGEVSTVKLEEVRSYSWNGEQVIGGDFPGTYDTISVRFDVETIFGIFPVEYKALLRQGRVLHWIDPVTEDRI